MIITRRRQFVSFNKAKSSPIARAAAAAIASPTEKTSELLFPSDNSFSPKRDQNQLFPSFSKRNDSSGKKQGSRKFDLEDLRIEEKSDESSLN